MNKRKATDPVTTEDLVNQNKKIRSEMKAPSPPFLGKVYSCGKDGSILITGNKQRIVLQGKEVITQLIPEGLKLTYYATATNMSSKHNEMVTQLHQQLQFRYKELRRQEKIQVSMNERITGEEMDEADLASLLKKKCDIDRLVRLHKMQIKKLLAKTTVQVNYQIHTSGLSCVLTVREFCKASFLSKPVCWVPHGLSLDIPCVALTPESEDKTQELPCGLSDTDCELFDKRMHSLSAEEQVARVNIYRRPSEAGNAYGQNLLGCCYARGYGVAQDMKKAVELYMLSAEQGNSWGQNNLGFCYREGHHVVLDKAKAVELYTASAQQGNAWAQLNLGQCFERGQGVCQDLMRARQWYERAAAQGNRKAIELVKNFRN